MTWEQWLAIISIVIAGYGAVISTILGIRELQKERKRIKIFLEHVSFFEKSQIRIVNVGHRPITINKIGMEVYQSTSNGEGFREDVPATSLIDGEFDQLPITLEDGEQVVLGLQNIVSGILYENQLRAALRIYDSEGKLHTKYERKIFNPKWGRYDPLPPDWK